MALPDDVIAAEHALRAARDEERRAGAVGPTSFLSVRGAAELLGLSPTTVLHRRQRERDKSDEIVEAYYVAGRDGKLHPSHRYDPTMRDAYIRAYRADGLSMRSIAKQCGCSVGTVHRVLSQRA